MGDRARTLSRLAVAGLAAAALAGCASSGHHHAATSAAGSAPTASAHLGHLVITGAYIPQPASPDVAAAYLTITNSGATPDTITSITTSVTTSVMAMKETDHAGVGSMTDLGTVIVPAHGRISLTPGRAHLMLDNPRSRLRAGQHVSVTITFVPAGKVTISLPVVPL